MSLFILKLIAIFTMLIDHMGIVLFDNNVWMRAVGRLAFPLFAWMIANGYFHTKDYKKYLMRLIIMAIISEPAFDFFLRGNSIDFVTQNIFFTLALGLIAIKLMDVCQSSGNRFGAVYAICVAIIGEMLSVDYGLIGVLMIVIMYRFYRQPHQLIIGVAGLYGFYFLNMYLGRGTIPVMAAIQGLGILSLIFINGYNYKCGPKLKYFFYVFYPVHLVVLKWMSMS